MSDMYDIVERRRWQADNMPEPKLGEWNIPYMLREDADEIERLKQTCVEHAEIEQNLVHEINTLRAALEPLLAEAKGVARMDGLRELIGNTNLACLEVRIENASTALNGDNSE